jgi:hypothetical protein
MPVFKTGAINRSATSPTTTVLLQSPDRSGVETGPVHLFPDDYKQADVTVQWFSRPVPSTTRPTLRNYYCFTTGRGFSQPRLFGCGGLDFVTHRLSRFSKVVLILGSQGSVLCSQFFIRLTWRGAERCRRRFQTRRRRGELPRGRGLPATGLTDFPTGAGFPSGGTRL